MVRLRRSVYKKSEESRKQVLDAAVAMFAEHGITSTSVQDIANAAGLSKGAVHYHFESKDELLQRVLEQCRATVERRVLAAFEEPNLPMDRVRRAIAEMWAVHRDDVAEVRVLAELAVLARQSEPIREALASVLRTTRQQVIDIGFSRLVEMGLRPRVPVDVAARLLLAMIDGLAVHHRIDPMTQQEEEELLRTIETTMLAVFEL